MGTAMESKQMPTRRGAGEHRQHQNWRGMGRGRLMSRGEGKRLGGKCATSYLLYFLSFY